MVAPAQSSRMSPAAINRTSGPRTVQLAQAYYDGAGTTGERDYGPLYNAIFEDYNFTGAVRSTTIARLRREVRNNPYLAGLVNKYPEAIGCSSLRSRTSDKAYNERKDLYWYRWSKRCTASGDSLQTLEEIVDRELLLAGEIFLILLRSGEVQVVSSEFCGSPSDRPTEREVNGIRYNSYGKPIAYRFGQLNAFGSVDFSDAASTVVEARYVIHIFHKDRVLMGRGLPWLLPSIQSARDLYEITRAKTKQIKDVSVITGTIETDRPETMGGLGLPSYDPTTQTDPEAEAGEAAADAQRTSQQKIELKPNQFVALNVGEKLNLLTSKYEAQDYKELIMLMLHAISSPVGLPVELWFSGLGDVNYSGFKGLGTQWNARRQYILKLKEDRFLNRLHFWRISKAVNEGDLPANPDGDDDLIEWSWRRTAVLDDEKHAKAVKTRTESGEKSIAEFWEEDGLWVEEVLEKRRQVYIKALIAAGDIDPDTDPTTVKVPITFLLTNQVPGAAKAGPDPIPVEIETNEE
jgi:capsid protein